MNIAKLSQYPSFAKIRICTTSATVVTFSKIVKIIDDLVTLIRRCIFYKVVVALMA